MTSVADDVVIKEITGVLLTFPVIPTICALSTEFIYIYLAPPLDADWLLSLTPG
jgi:hypothetical protein